MWLPQSKAESGYSMKILRADGRKKFILHKFQTSYKKRGILIKYVVPYVHKENRMAEQGWHTIITIKDSMLIDNRLLNGFWAEAMETVKYLQNKLPIKSKTHGEMILEKAKIG